MIPEAICLRESVEELAGQLRESLVEPDSETSLLLLGADVINNFLGEFKEHIKF
jgi:hypothetical protein